MQRAEDDDMSVRNVAELREDLRNREKESSNLIMFITCLYELYERAMKYLPKDLIYSGSFSELFFFFLYK